MLNKLKELTAKVDWFGDAICVMCIPLAILRHMWHLVCVILSVLAVILSDMITVVTGRVYTQNLDIKWTTQNQFQYCVDQGLPNWYIQLTLTTTDDITQFHLWLVEKVSILHDDDDDDLAGQN